MRRYADRQRTREAVSLLLPVCPGQRRGAGGETANCGKGGFDSQFQVLLSPEAEVTETAGAVASDTPRLKSWLLLFLS